MKLVHSLTKFSLMSLTISHIITRIVKFNNSESFLEKERDCPEKYVTNLFIIRLNISMTTDNASHLLEMNLFYSVFYWNNCYFTFFLKHIKYVQMKEALPLSLRLCGIVPSHQWKWINLMFEITELNDSCHRTRICNFLKSVLLS